MAYPDITPLPTPPNPDAPATFDTLAYPFTVAQVAMVAQINALVGQLNDTFFPDMPVRATLRGSAALPVYTFNADPDTGMWSPAANILAFSTGGIERLRITAAGLLTSATAITQSAADTTAGRLLKVGDFGWGNTTGGPLLANLDAFDIAAGQYLVTSATTGTKPAEPNNNAIVLLVLRPTFNQCTQILSIPNAGSTYIRKSLAASGWTEWTRILNSADVTQTATDPTTGRLLKVGDFGVGGYAVPLVDFNDATLRNGTYRANSTTANYDAVLGNNFGLLIVANSGTVARQIYLPDGASAAIESRRMFIRSWDGSSWTPWQYVFTQRNIVGTVSADGSGVPTGAVIERGSNANGDFTRWADGTQICWRATAMGTDPAAFVDTPVSIDGGKMKIGRWR